MATDKSPTTVYLDPTLKDAAMAMAKADDRSLSSWIERLVKAAIRKGK